MHLQPRQPQNQRQGYTLVELLLTTSLLMLFASLAVISMSTLNQGSSFGEGTVRFETMMRFAHAEAARSGHRVRIDFVQETNDVAGLGGTNQLSQVRLSWEPNPAAAPDVFLDLSGPRWGIDQVNDTVRVVDVRLVDDQADQSTNSVDGPTMDDAAPPIQPPDDGTSLLPGFPTALSSVTFNPDGSCDAAEITLVGMPPEDDRRVIIKVDGLTGEVTHKTMPVGDPSTNAPAAGTNTLAIPTEKWPSN